MDILLITPTKVEIGTEFSTDFRYLRKAITSPVTTYFVEGRTLEFISGRWVYTCGPFEIAAGDATPPGSVSNTSFGVTL